MVMSHIRSRCVQEQVEENQVIIHKVKWDLSLVRSFVDCSVFANHRGNTNESTNENTNDKKGYPFIGCTPSITSIDGKKVESDV